MCLNKPILFTINGCSQCHEVKTFLLEQGFEYVEVNIFEEYEQIKKLKEVSGEIVTPVLLINNTVLKKDDIFSIKHVGFCD